MDGWMYGWVPVGWGLSSWWVSIRLNIDWDWDIDYAGDIGD